MLYQTKNPHGGDIYGGDIRWDFSANTNPLGTPPGVLQAVQGCLTQLHRYPDPYCRELVQAISQFESVPASWVLCGSGAAELIYSYCRCIQARKAVELAPTFSEYSLALGLWVCPSEANYLLFQGPEGLDKLLRQEGIALRNCGNYHGLCQGWYRTAVRLQEENTILIQALSGALGKEVPWQKTL